MKKFSVSGISNMKILVFYLACERWKLSTSECYAIFEKYKLLEFINTGYEHLRLLSYECIVDELEKVLLAGGGMELISMNKAAEEKIG